MDNYNDNVYNISLETVGNNILKNNDEIVQEIFGCGIRKWFDSNSDIDFKYQIAGADFQLEDNNLVDIKCSMGNYGTGYYTALVISVERFNGNSWKDVLLSKMTDYWLFISQTAKDRVEFFTLDRKNAAILQHFHKTEGKKGGKLQRYVVIDFNNPIVKRHPIVYNPITQEVIKEEQVGT